MTFVGHGMIKLENVSHAMEGTSWIQEIALLMRRNLTLDVINGIGIISLVKNVRLGLSWKKTVVHKFLTNALIGMKKGYAQNAMGDIFWSQGSVF